MVNIEQLQEKVDAVKVNLEDLKSEVSVEVKKEKEKETLDKIKDTKEEINNKIDELKQLGETQNASDILKLQEMVLSLDEQAKLKLEVASSSNIDTDVEDVADIDLDSDVVEEPTEEEKGWFKKQLEAVTDKEEWKEHTMKNVGRVAMGVGAVALAWKGAKWLFGIGKDKEKEGEGDGDKKEKKPRYKKRWGMAGIGIGGILAWKNWDKIKGWFGGLFGGEKPKEGDGNKENVEDSPKEFKEKLSESEKKVYNNFADQVNDFYQTGAGDYSEELKGDLLGNASFETYDKEKVQGVVPFMLNNSYKTEGIKTLLSEGTFYREMIGVKSDVMVNKIKGRSADKLGNFLAPIAGKIDGMMPFWLDFKVSKKKDDLMEFIKGNNDAQEVIKLAFRKTVMVISYLKSRENSLAYKVTYNYLMENDKTFKDLSDEDKLKMIYDKLDDEDFVEKTIEPVITEFNSKSVYEGIKFLDKYKCLDGKLDEFTQEAVDEVEDRRKELLDEDGDGDNRIDDIKSEFESDKLSEDGKEDLDSLLIDFEEDIDDMGSKSWYNKYIPLMNMFDASDEIMENIIATGDYEKVIKVYKDKIIEIKNKSKDGTLKESDMDDLKNVIDDYYVFQKSLVMSQTNIEKVFDDNGNLIIRWGSTVVQSGENLWTGGEMIVDGKYLKGGVIAAGALVSLDLLTAPVRFFMPIGMLRKSPSVKTIKFVVEKGFKLTGKTIDFSLRNNYPAFLAKGIYRGKEALFKYDLLRGKLPLSRALKIANKLGFGDSKLNYLKSETELLQKYLGCDKKSGDLLVKYRDKNNLIKQIIKGDSHEKWYKLDSKKVKYSFTLNDKIKELEKIDDFFKVCKHEGKASLVKGFMETTKSLKSDMIDEIFATKTFDKLLVGDSKDIGRLLGKKMDKFTSLDDFKAFQGFFARNYAKYHSKTFVRNSLSNWSKLSVMDDTAQALYIKEAGLNLSKYQRVSNKVKIGVTNMITDLNNMLKNAKMKKFHPGIKSKITSLTEYAKSVTPESIKAMKDTNWLDKFTGFGKLSDEGIAAMKALNTLIKTDTKILEALSKANKLDDVKDVLRNAGVAVDRIDDGVLMKIVQTKNASKIQSIVNYGAEIKSISVWRKVLKNPAMKTFGRYLGVVGVAVDVAFVGIDFMSDTKEAQAIKQHNLARGENKESEAYFDVISGGIGATALAVGLFNIWNPVGRVSLGVGGAAMGAEALGGLYYGEIDKFKQNYKDFLSKSAPEIKQRLIHINSWQTGLDSSFQDFWSNLTGNMDDEEKQKVSVKTSADAVKALIYFEEMQKYPYASEDLNDPEIRNNPSLEALVKQQKTLHDKAVETRYAYIKKNYIDGKTSIVSTSDVKDNKGIEALDNILAESRVCQSVEADANYTNKADVKGYKKYLESELKKSNTDGFAKLEKMYVGNKVHFFKIVASLSYYKHMMNEYLIDDENYDKIVSNLEFFEKYVNYKLMDVAVSDYPTVIVDEDKIDYDEITNLLIGWKSVATTLTAAEVSSANVEYLTDAQVIEKYNVSTNLGQNILYEIANSHGYMGKNDLVELKVFFREDQKEINGIYWHSKDKDRAINENNGSDNEFATDAELNSKESIIKMREWIDDAANSFATGNMITGNDFANKELAREYISIINKNLDYRIDSKKYYLEILMYIKRNSNGGYIKLPSDLLISGIKTGLANVGAFVYSRDGEKFDAKTSIKGLKSALIRN